MRRKNNNATIISIVCLILLAIGIGYAYLTSNLSITGATSVAGNTWDIHFENVQVSGGSVEATIPAAIDNNDNTQINYAVTLNRPGDFYEFTVDMVNGGTLPGKISLVELNGITSAVEDIIEYSVVYTETNDSVAVNDILNPYATKNIKVKIYFKEDIDEEDLPSSNVLLNIVFNINFGQSDTEERLLNPQTIQLMNDNSDCFSKYNGYVTDKVGLTKMANNVYYNTCVNKRHIIFANTCWQMIRTTENGGIKMIYNGEPVNGKCESTRSNHKGVTNDNGSGSLLNLAPDILYSSSYDYDLDNDTFTLINPETGTWSTNNYLDFIGKYTCNSASSTCATLYQFGSITSYYTNQPVVAIYTVSNTAYSQIGSSSYNPTNPSLSNAGYMYNSIYTQLDRQISTDYRISNGIPYGSSYWYADSYTYDSSTNKYALNNPYKITSSNIQDFVGKYTFYNTDSNYTYNTVRYITHIDDGSAYTLSLSNGNTLEDVTKSFVYGESYIDNGTGTYTINNPSTLTSQNWYSNKNDFINKYLCINPTNNSCSNLYYVIFAGKSDIHLNSVTRRYIYSSGFTYDESTNMYTLNNDKQTIWDLSRPDNISYLYHHRYTCFNNTGTCEQLYYIYDYHKNDSNAYYITLANGKDNNDAINEMLYNDNVNTKNSRIKYLIDLWYSKTLLNYTDKLEDTVYCNDRFIDNYMGWSQENSYNPETYDILHSIIFKNFNANNDLSCSNLTDQFAVSNNKAKLTYPVALPTIGELNFYGESNEGNNLRKSAYPYFTMTPKHSDFNGGSNWSVSYYGTLNVQSLYMLNGVRPVITLSNENVFSSGTGTDADPWIVE